MEDVIVISVAIKFIILFRLNAKEEHNNIGKNWILSVFTEYIPMARVVNHTLKHTFIKFPTT